MSYTVIPSKVVVAFDPALDGNNVPILPGDVETAWRNANGPLAAELDAACAWILGSHPTGATIFAATQTAMNNLASKLVSATISANPSYKGGGGGHSGNSWVYQGGVQLAHQVNVNGTNVMCYPSVYAFVS